MIGSLLKGLGGGIIIGTIIVVLLYYIAWLIWT
jgi:hypothetical protein